MGTRSSSMTSATTTRTLMISKDLLLEGERGILLEMFRLGYFEPIHRTDIDYFLLRSAYANPIQFINIQYVSIYSSLLTISRRLCCLENYNCISCRGENDISMSLLST